jgi:hypothetical protein
MQDVSVALHAPTPTPEPSPQPEPIVVPFDFGHTDSPNIADFRLREGFQRSAISFGQQTAGVVFLADS